MNDYLYPSFAAAILSVVNIFSIGGITSWAYAVPTLGSLSSDGSLTLDDDPRIGSVLRRVDLDKAISSLVVSPVFNAEWIFIGPKATIIDTRGILFTNTLLRAFRVAGTPEYDLEMCIAPLEPCEVPIFP